MSIYMDLSAGLKKILNTRKKDLTKEDIEAFNHAAAVLDAFDDEYPEVLQEALEYVRDNAEPIIEANDDPAAMETVNGYTTLLYSTETAESDPAFDEALEKFPDISADDLSERLADENTEDLNILENDELGKLCIPCLCIIGSLGRWNGTRLAAKTINDATIKDIVGIGSSSRDYMNFTLYCKDGHLRMKAEHHDATDSFAFLSVTDEDKFEAYMESPEYHQMTNQQELLNKLLEQGLAKSLVPKIAESFGITLK